MNQVLNHYVLTNSIDLDTPFPLKNVIKFEETENSIKCRYIYENGVIVDIDYNPIITLIRSNKKIIKMPNGKCKFDLN